MRFQGWKTLVVLVAIAWGADALAQGVQTSTFTGRVSVSDGSPVPGVAVSIESEALQGTQSTTTDINGVFSLRALPPGRYEATFELEGFTTIRRTVDLPLGVTVELDTIMAITPVQETVVVTGQAPPMLAATETSTNLRQIEAEALPVGRQPFEIASLAPSVTENTPNASQLSIAGSFAYDNVFLVDGVDVNDNVLGKADTLFIEEAIDELQVLTSGISAEYGRFSGGVVNVITKSGGNTFSGALRVSLANPAWTVETPFERERDVERNSKLSTSYEGTLGGPISKDKLWFFGATRIERSDTENVYAETGVPYTSSTDNTRFEVKLTGTLQPGHTLQGSYIENRTALAQPALPFSLDPATYGYPRTPNRLFGVNYKGVIGSRVLGQLRYSRKTYHIRDVGGTASAIVDSPFLTRTGTMYQYNAPYFDATDPENRDNQQLAGSLSFFLSTPDFGTHDVKVGGEWFRSTRVGGNSPTSTGYVFWADLARDANGSPALDADGRLIPRFVPGPSTLMFTYMPQRGAQIDVDTTSFYLTDHWIAGRHWTFDLGVRYEHARSQATGGISGAKTDVIVPRLGASYDMNGDGRTVLQATWAHYSGKHNDVQFSRNSNVGNSDAIVGIYLGPPGEGRGFAPGFDPDAYFTVDGNFPTANVSFADDLHAPITREFTAAIGQEVGQKGFVKAVYVWRRMSDFVEDFVTIDAGTTTIVREGVNFGTFDNVVYQNSDLPTRRYQALELRSNYRFAANLSVSGNWTIQLKNDGNFEGEDRNKPAIPSIIGDYPEIFVEARNYPSGHLSSFQRHKVRVWGLYTMRLGRFGSLDVAPLYRFDSGRAYSLVASVPLSAEQLANDPGYANLGGMRQLVYFGKRGGQRFEDSHLVDLALTYQVPVWRSVRPWIELEVFNLFNNQKLATWDVTVAADPNGRVDEFGLPLDYIEGPNFGEAISASNYARPLAGIDGGRTVLVAFGMRF